MNKKTKAISFVQQYSTRTNIRKQYLQRTSYINSYYLQQVKITIYMYIYLSLFPNECTRMESMWGRIWDWPYTAWDRRTRHGPRGSLNFPQGSRNDRSNPPRERQGERTRRGNRASTAHVGWRKTYCNDLRIGSGTCTCFQEGHAFSPRYIAFLGAARARRTKKTKYLLIFFLFAGGPETRARRATSSLSSDPWRKTGKS